MNYAVEYFIKGETGWRRTMDQPLDMMRIQEEELWKNPGVVATRMIAYYEEVRLLTPEEIAQVNI